MSFRQVIICDNNCGKQTPQLGNEPGWIQASHPDLAETITAIKVVCDGSTDKCHSISERKQKVFHFCGIDCLAEYVKKMASEKPNGVVPIAVK